MTCEPSRPRIFIGLEGRIDSLIDSYYTIQGSYYQTQGSGYTFHVGNIQLSGRMLLQVFKTQFLPRYSLCIAAVGV